MSGAAGSPIMGATTVRVAGRTGSRGILGALRGLQVSGGGGMKV